MRRLEQVAIDATDRNGFGSQPVLPRLHTGQGVRVVSGYRLQAAGGNARDFRKRGEGFLIARVRALPKIAVGVSVFFPSRLGQSSEAVKRVKVTFQDPLQLVVGAEKGAAPEAPKFGKMAVQAGTG